MNGSAQEQLQQIAIGQIAESTTNPRKSFTGMEDLKASIAESGIRVPLLVREREPNSPNGVFAAGEPVYELVCGARRLRAARELKLATVPCIVRTMDDAAVLEEQIVENLQRADVHPVEEAEAYAAMVEHAAGWTAPGEPARAGVNLSAEDIARRVGKTAGYVAQRLKLLTLGLDAKLLFVRGHLTLGHALLLARLTEADQGRALMWMLDADPKYTKQPLTEIIRERLVSRGEEKPQDEAEEEIYDEDAENEILLSGGRTVPNVAKYMHEGKRLIEATEAQLKRWVEANVLLKLADVPWRLDDANLMPAAGGCTACPKRSGSNAALFGDLTAAEDVCLDPACFSAKQDAVVKQHKMEARKAGADALLKISSKRSKDKLDEPAVTRGSSGAVDGKGAWIVVTKKAVREGQWVPAEAGSCPMTVQGLMVDGPDKGKVQPVCADQACKVHKHDVHRASSGGGGYNPADYAKQQKEREEKERAYVAAELPVRKAVYAAIKQKAAGKLSAEVLLRRTAKESISNCDEAAICELAGIAFKRGEQGWESSQNAAKPLGEALAKWAGSELLNLVFDILNVDAVTVNENAYANRKGDRAELWELAAQYKVDADAIAKQLEPKPAPAAKKAAKAVAKPAVKKTASRAKALSAASRKRVAEAMKKRWAGIQAAKKKAKA